MTKKTLASLRVAQKQIAAAVAAATRRSATS